MLSRYALGSEMYNTGKRIMDIIASGGGGGGGATKTPETYGAIGNGIIDDTNAMQECITANRNIFFLSGKTYRITQTIIIPSNTHIDLGGSTILTNDGITQMNFLNANGSYATNIDYLFYTEGTTNIALTNGKLAQCKAGFGAVNVDKLYCDKLEIYYCGRALAFTQAHNGMISNMYLHDNRRTCLEMANIDWFVIQNIKIYNPSVWAIHFDSISHTIIDNAYVSYDITYASFWGGSTEDVLNFAFLNYGYPPATWTFDTGVKVVERAGILMNLENVMFINCNWDVNEIITQVVQGIDVKFDHCQFNLSCTLSNVGGSGYFEAIDFIYDSCYITGLNFLSNTYGTGGKWINKFINCVIDGALSFTNESGGIIVSSDITFELCDIYHANQSTIMNQFDGYLRLKNCNLFQHLVIPLEVFKFEFFTDVGDLSSAFIEMDNCKINNVGTSAYGIVFINYSSLGSSPHITLNNCKFSNSVGLSISNNKCALNIENSNIEGGTILNTNGTIDFINSVMKSVEIDDNITLNAGDVWYRVATHSNTGAFNLVARSIYDNAEYLYVNSSLGITNNRDRYNITNSPTVLVSTAAPSAPVMVLDYVEGFPRDDFLFNGLETIAQEFTYTSSFYAYQIYSADGINVTLPLGTEIKLYEGSYDISPPPALLMYSGLIEGDIVVGGNMLLCTLNPPVLINANETYTFYITLPIGEAGLVRTTFGLHENSFYLEGSLDPQRAMAFYIYGMVTPTNCDVYVKGGAASSTVTSQNHDRILYPIVDCGNGAYPTNITEYSILYDSSMQNGKKIITDKVSINNVTANTSTTAGALIVTGGVGISGHLYATGIATLDNSTTSLDTNSGALVVRGGVGIGGDIHFSNSFAHSSSNVRGDLRVFNSGGWTNFGTLTSDVSGSIDIETAGGTSRFLDVTESTSTSTGAVTVAGGMGIAGNLNVGGSITSGDVSIVDFSGPWAPADAVGPATFVKNGRVVNVTFQSGINFTGSGTVLCLAMPPGFTPGTNHSFIISVVNNSIDSYGIFRLFPMNIADVVVGPGASSFSGNCSIRGFSISYVLP